MCTWSKRKRIFVEARFSKDFWAWAREVGVVFVSIYVYFVYAHVYTTACVNVYVNVYLYVHMCTCKATIYAGVMLITSLSCW